MKRNVKLLKIEPSIKELPIGLQPTITISVVEVEVNDENTNEFLYFAYEQIGCDCIDVTTFGGHYNENHFSVTVDDEGLLKSGNVAMELKLPIVDMGVVTLELCGTILIGHCSELEGKPLDGLYEVGLTDEQIEYVQNNLEIRVIGLTR